MISGLKRSTGYPVNDSLVHVYSPGRSHSYWAGDTCDTWSFSTSRPIIITIGLGEKQTSVTQFRILLGRVLLLWRILNGRGLPNCLTELPSLKCLSSSLHSRDSHLFANVLRPSPSGSPRESLKSHHTRNKHTVTTFASRTDHISVETESLKCVNPG